MKKVIVILSLLCTIFFPKESFSQNEITKNLKDLGKLEIANIKNELCDNTKTLSQLKEDLKRIYTSMSASQAKDRFLIIRSCKDVKNIERMYAQISSNEALHLIDKAKETTRSSLELLDKAVEIIERQIDHNEERQHETRCQIRPLV